MADLRNARAEYAAALETIKSLELSGCTDRRAITRAGERAYKAQCALEHAYKAQCALEHAELK